MKSTKIVLSTLVLFSFFTHPAFTQERPMTWGEIPLAQLRMKSFPADTNASAIILCDFGESYINDDLEVVHERHSRIKILSSGGYPWGTISISLFVKDNMESLRSVEGCTYSLDSTGAVRKTVLDRNDVFTESTSENVVRHKFTLPALTPGCVIEYRFTTVAKSLFLVPDWVFQKSEPVLWSEYRVRAPASIAYTAVTQGYEPFAVAQNRDVKQVFQPPALSYLGSSNIINCIERRYVVRDIKALRDEPYITTLADYANKVDFQLAGYSFVGAGIKRVLHTWPVLIEELLDSDAFGDQIDVTGDVEDVAEEVTKGLSTSLEKMQAIYKWVSSSIVWDGNQRTHATQDVDDVLETKKGNSAEITFLLLSLLRSVEIDCHPVLLSTRGNGRIQDQYPIVSQFNYVLAKVIIGNQTYYLDATDSSRPPELLPTKVLNVKGLVIQPKKQEWVTLTSNSKDVRIGTANLQLSEDGRLTGDVTVEFRGYGSVNIRHLLKEKKDIEIVKEVFDAEEEALQIDSVRIENREDHSLPLVIKAWISSESYAQKAGSIIYINPHILFRLRNNPFKTRDRKFPVDYAYGRETVSTVNLTIPEGFVLEERFVDKSNSIRDQISFSRNLAVTDSLIRLSCTMLINTTVFPPETYARLRDLYSFIAASHADQLVLRPAGNQPSKKPTTR